MALIIDTRFLIAHTFPPSDDERVLIKEFTKKLAKEKLFIPSVVIVEFLKAAGLIMGYEPAKIRIRLWISGGAKIVPIDEEVAFEAGEIALRYRHVPLADTIVCAVAKRFNGKIVSDDQHYNILDVKTVWYK